MMTRPCPSCYGNGHVDGNICDPCAGEGVVPAPKMTRQRLIENANAALTALIENGEFELKPYHELFIQMLDAHAISYTAASFRIPNSGDEHQRLAEAAEALIDVVDPSYVEDIPKKLTKIAFTLKALPVDFTVDRKLLDEHSMGTRAGRDSSAVSALIEKARPKLEHPNQVIDAATGEPLPVRFGIAGRRKKDGSLEIESVSLCSMQTVDESLAPQPNTKLELPAMTITETDPRLEEAVAARETAINERPTIDGIDTEEIRRAVSIPLNTPTTHEALDALAAENGGELPPVKVVKFKNDGPLDFSDLPAVLPGDTSLEEHESGCLTVKRDDDKRDDDKRDDDKRDDDNR